MRLIESGDRLVLRDVPGALWMLGLAFVGSGLFVLTVPFWAPEWRDFGPWARLAVLVLGAAHLGGGLMTASKACATVTELDRARGRGSQRVDRLWSRWGGTRGPEPTEFALDDVRAVEIVQSKDDDGDPEYRMRLSLARSETVWLHAQAVPGEAHAREQAARVRRFLGVEDASVP